MRITNQMMIQNAMRGLRFNLEAMAQAQAEAITGRRVTTVSDSPIDAGKIMGVNSQISDLDQYRKNGIAAGVRISTEEAVLSTVQDMISRARTAATTAMALEPDEPGRQAALAEVALLRDQIISLGNTKLGTEYIFGGSLTTMPPFQADGTYIGDGQSRQIEVDLGITTETNHTGSPLFTDVLETLDELHSSLAANSPSDIRESIGKLDAAVGKVLTAQTEVGVRNQVIKDVSARITKRTNELLDQLSSLRDVDPTEASMKVVAAQTALERAYSVVGKTLSTDILKYL